MQASYLSLQVLLLRQGGDAPGVDLIASQIDVKFLTTKTFVWFFPFPLMPLRVEQSSFPIMFSKLGLLGEASILRVPVHIPKYSPDCSRSGES